MKNEDLHASQPPGATRGKSSVGPDLSGTGSTSSQGGGVARPTWYRLYFALAAFDLLTVSFSLYLSHRLRAVHDQSVRVNQEWSQRLNRFSDVAQVGGEVNAPGNDVFDSRDVPGESARLRAALDRFNQKLATAEADLDRNVAPAHAGFLRQDLVAVRQAMSEMIDEAELIFSHFRQSQPDKAGERMATMDRKYARLNTGFAHLAGHIRQIQAENFRAQQTESAELRRFAYAIAAAIAVMILSVTFYGHRMVRAMTVVMEEKERYFGALRQAHQELETRTRDLQQANKELKGEISGREMAQRELEATHQVLLDLSRQAGMAEVATGVLHNVGNVLNSVNVSANLLSDQVRKTPVADLGRVVTLLREQGANLGAFFTSDPRGPKVTNFLAELADKFTRQQEKQLQEVASLQKNIEHIKDIVATQQSFAKVSGLNENLSPVELIENALRMNAGSFEKHEVELVQELAADLPRVCVDKHKVLQILVNLLRNAKHACEDAGRPDKRITVRAVSENERVRITIADNGVGIPPENLTRIFNHGFTTKKEGHGFGLHSAANAAKEMGGGITAHSEGTGHGATFTLELPVEAPRGLNATTKLANDRTGLNSVAQDSKPILEA